MKENVVVNLSFEFAVQVVELDKELCFDRKKYVMSKQLLRSGTSIGANIREAVVSQSKKSSLLS